nr:MAG TPA: hypothetical protein [Caudoviricetes sp.]
MISQPTLDIFFHVLTSFSFNNWTRPRTRLRTHVATGFMGGVCPICPIFCQNIYIRVFAFFTCIRIHTIIHIFIFYFLYK